MKRPLTVALVVIGLLALAPFSGRTQTNAANNTDSGLNQTNPAPSASPVTVELKALSERVIAKLKTGLSDEGDFAPEIKSFDDLLAKHADEKTDEVAQVLYLKAMLYLQVFEKPDQALLMVQQLKRDYPATATGKAAEKLINYINQKQASLKTQSALKAGNDFPDFNVKDLNGNPLSVGALKGKVVLVDFWATWCGPCRGELPNVINVYKNYHAKGFEIIGVSLDSEKDQLTKFLGSQDGMTWAQYFDGQGWQNALAQKYGVESIPFTVLVGSDGKIIGTDLRGEALADAVQKALK